MSSEQTIRQRAAERKQAHRRHQGRLERKWCQECGREFPCPDHIAFKAILDTLNAAKRKFDVHGTAFRFVRDSEQIR